MNQHEKITQRWPTWDTPKQPNTKKYARVTAPAPKHTGTALLLSAATSIAAAVCAYYFVY